MPGPGGEGSGPGGLPGGDPPSRTATAADGSYWNAFLFKLFYCYVIKNLLNVSYF